VTDVYGPGRAFVLFNVAGAFGFLVSNVMSPAPSIGASGSIFGLLAALIVYGRRRGSSMMSQQLWQWAIVLFVFGFLMPGINNWAHAGGFAGGWVGAYAMGFVDEQRESTSMLLLALAFIAITAVGIVLSFTKVTGILLGG
jgi:rhomboid protease GluP